MPARILAIGDIHGCDTALETLLIAVAPQPGDTVVVLGDVVDRGPSVRRSIDLLLNLQRRCELVFILGNHEEMMLDSADTGDWMADWMMFGGRETLDSYGRPGRLDDVPESHFDFLKSGRNWHVCQHDTFIHANLDPELPLERQPPEMLRWAKLRGDEPPHPSGRRVVCGHTRLRTGVPAVFPGWVCIDTWCYGGQWLTCLDVTTDTVWQANQRGESRGPAPLSELATPLE